jgi:methylenetetrahydrofolate reductase (NADPH)
VTIPILAGLLPTTEPRRLRRVEELTGVVPPQRLLAELDALPDPEAQHAHGIAFSVKLAQRVLDAGAPGLHVYTFNKYRPALDLLEGVDLGGRANGTDHGAGGDAVPEASAVGADLARRPWVPGIPSHAPATASPPAEP